MKRIIAMILIGLLVAPPTSAGQKQGKPIDWQKAQKLKPGYEIVLTATGGQPTKVRLLFADDAILVTLNPTAPKAQARRVVSLRHRPRLAGDHQRWLVQVRPPARVARRLVRW